MHRVLDRHRGDQGHAREYRLPTIAVPEGTPPDCEPGADHQQAQLQAEHGRQNRQPDPWQTIVDQPRLMMTAQNTGSASSLAIIPRCRTPGPLRTKFPVKHER